MRKKVALLLVLAFVFTLIIPAGVNAAGPDTVMSQALSAAAPGGSLLSVNREEAAPSIFHYTFTVKVGPGEYDEIAIHRLVQEQAGSTAGTKAVMMLPGDSCTFSSAFLTPTNASGQASSFACYLAGRGIDVWGIDFRWSFVPDGTTDFSFMQNWNTALHLQDIKLAVRAAREFRSLSGYGDGRFFLLGHSRGAQYVYAYANDEALLPQAKQDICGIIPMDFALKSNPLDLVSIASSKSTYRSLKTQYQAGTYESQDGLALKQAAYLAAGDPGGSSQILSGLTNMQVALASLTATYLTMSAPYPLWFHYLAGTFGCNLLPTGLKYADQAAVLSLALNTPAYQSLGELIDGEAMFSGSADLPYDNHLPAVKVPVFYVGAAGGIGTKGIYTTALLGSKDKRSLVIRLYPLQPLRDYGHADLLWANNASSLVWKPIAAWIAAR